MPAEQKINPEIWDFWTRTQQAWASGALNHIGPSFQSAASSVMKVEQFADTTPAVVKALKELNSTQDEYLVAWLDDADFILTNKRYMIRRCKGGDHDIYDLSNIRSYTDKGWWTKTVTITTRDGRSTTYREQSSSVKPEIINQLLAEPLPPIPGLHVGVQPSPEISPVDTSKSELQPKENDMPDEEMIGAAYPVFQQLIKNRLMPGEQLLAFTTATTKIGGAGAAYLPFGLSILELARSLTLTPYLLAVTDQRFLIIQVNRFSRITKEIKETAFEEVPIKQIRTAAASKHFSFVYSKLEGEILKIEVGDGRKYTFRNISSENATMIRDAILGNQG